MTTSLGLNKENQYRQAGFTEAEIMQWRARRESELLGAGFSAKEVNEHFGVKEFNKKPLEEHFKANLKNIPVPETKPESKAALDTQKEVSSLYDAIEHGLQISLPGLGFRGKLPDQILTEHTGSFYRTAAQLAATAGDLTTLVPQIGGTLGAIAGTLSPLGPGIGTAVGFGAGGAGLTEFMRSFLIDAYKNGEVKSFEDFWERASAVFLDTAKATAVGGFTLGTGAKVGKILGPVGAPQIYKTGVVLASEVAAMVSLGKALEGQVPEPTDFFEAAVVIGGLHGAMGSAKAGVRLTKNASSQVAEKLRNIYSKSGNTPAEVAAMAIKDPSIQEDLLSSNIEFPRALDVNPPKTEVEIPKELTTIGPGFVEEPVQKMRVEDFKIAEPEPSRPSTGVLSKAEEAIAGRIAAVGEEPNLKTWKDLFNSIYTNRVDATHVMKGFVDALSEQPVETIKNPQHLMRLYAGNSGRVQHFLTYGTYDVHTLKITGKALDQVFEPIKNELDRWSYYAVSKRVVELEGRNIETGFGLEEAKQVIKEGASKYEKVTKEFYEFNNRVIDYMVDAGVIAPHNASLIKKANQAYIPFNRLMAEAIPKGQGQNYIARNPLKGIEGSKKLVLDPIVTTIQNLFTNISAAEKNLIGLAMKELADNSEIGDQYMKRKTGLQEVKMAPPEVAKLLKEYGVETNSIEARAFSFYAPDKTLGKNEIPVFVDGKRQIYEVSEDLAAVMKGLDYQTSKLVIKMIGESAKALRVGHTMTPEFLLRSWGSDQFDAFIKSKNGYKPFLTGAEGVAAVFKRSEDYQLWLRSGAGAAEFHTMYKDYMQTSISDLQKTGMFNNVRNVIKYPFELLRLGEVLAAKTKEVGNYVLKPLKFGGELAEQGPRVGDFIRGTRHDKSAANVKAQGYNSRELTVDYRRMGAAASTKAYSLMTTFWNAKIQGVDRTVRTFLENPEATLMRGIGSISSISTYLWFANHKDPRWNDEQAISRAQKAMFWIVLTDDEIYRIKKPWEMGLIFGTLTEMLLDRYWDENPKAFDQLSPVFLDAINPFMPPPLITPIIEHQINKKLHTGAPIVPYNLWGKNGERTLPEAQYTDYTTEAAKKLGQFIRNFTREDNTISSPAIIENYIVAWTGTLGMYALQLADQLLIKSGVIDNPNKPAAKIEEYPFLRAFMIKYPTAQNQNIQDFYQKYDEVQQRLNTIKTYYARGDVDRVVYHLENSQNLLDLSQAKLSINAQDAYRHKILQNPKILPTEKNQMNDNILFGMIHTAKQGLKYYEEFEKQLKAVRMGKQ